MENGLAGKVYELKEHFDSRHDDIEAALKQLMLSTERLSKSVDNLTENVNQFASITREAMQTVKEISKDKSDKISFKEITVLILAVISVFMLFVGIFHGDIKGSDVVNKIPNISIGEKLN